MNSRRFEAHWSSVGGMDVREMGDFILESNTPHWRCTNTNGKVILHAVGYGPTYGDAVRACDENVRATSRRQEPTEEIMTNSM